MLSKKQFLALFLAVALPFFFYFLRFDLIGFDSYHFLGMSCNFDALRGEAPLYILVLPFIPCNILAIKAVLFACCFVSVLFLSKTGMLFDEKNGWLAGLLVFLSFIFLFEFLKFENDQFALPFLFSGTYFFFKSLQKKLNRQKLQLLALVLFLIGAGFWGGLILYVLPLALVPHTDIFKGAGLSLLALLHQQIISALIGFQGVLENTPVIGLIWIIFLLPGLVGWHKRKELLYPGIVFAGLSLLMPKFRLFLIVFLVNPFH